MKHSKSLGKVLKYGDNINTDIISPAAVYGTQHCRRGEIYAQHFGPRSSQAGYAGPFVLVKLAKLSAPVTKHHR